MMYGWSRVEWGGSLLIYSESGDVEDVFETEI